MALSNAERLLVVQDTLRGLEADQIRAEIQAPSDPGQASRLVIINAQIELAQQTHDSLVETVQAEEQERAAAADALVKDADPASFQDDYDNLTKDELLERAELKGISDQIKSDYNKTDIIIKLRADDLTH